MAGDIVFIILPCIAVGFAVIMINVAEHRREARKFRQISRDMQELNSGERKKRQKKREEADLIARLDKRGF